MLKICFLLFLACTFSVRCSYPLLSFDGTLDLNIVTNAVSNVVRNVLNDIVDPVVKRLLLTVSREFVRFALRLEFFTMATGNHFTQISIPMDEMDLEYHKIAAATTSLWQQLCFMEQVEEVITNATVEVIQNTDDLLTDLNIKNETKIHTILKLLLHRVNLALSQDPNLQSQYDSFKMKFGVHFNSTRHETDANGWTAKMFPSFQPWFTIPHIKKYVINKMFLIQSMQSSTFTENERERYLLARSLIQLSKDPRKRREVQKLYDDSVQETVDLLVSTANEDASRVSVDSGFLGELSQYLDRITSSLFSTLKDKIQNNPMLKRDLEDAQTLIMKGNKGVRIYHIDYWPL